MHVQEECGAVLANTYQSRVQEIVAKIPVKAANNIPLSALSETYAYSPQEVQSITANLQQNQDIPGISAADFESVVTEDGLPLNPELDDGIKRSPTLRAVDLSDFSESLAFSVVWGAVRVALCFGAFNVLVLE